MQEKILEKTVLGTIRRRPSHRRNTENSHAGPIPGVVYCRVSTKEQIEGTSLESQEVACKEYARNHNITVLRTFVERGESAKVADRTQLIELIDFCREGKGKVQALLVWKVVPIRAECRRPLQYQGDTQEIRRSSCLRDRAD